MFLTAFILKKKVSFPDNLRDISKKDLKLPDDSIVKWQDLCVAISTQYIFAITFHTLSQILRDPTI